MRTSTPLRGIADPTHKLRLVRREREAYLAELHTPDLGMSDKTREAALYIHRHFFEETCTVQQLKGDLSIRDHNFSSYFKRTMGLGLKEYILHHRLTLAKRLLRHRELSIFLIALSVGFCSHEAFTMAFKVHQNCTPSSFRNQLDQQNPT